jgi:tetratricopeptide (TPR) repeat protein
MNQIPIKIKASIQLVIAILLLSILCFSCKKGWLEVKPRKELVVPITIADFQALMDNTTSGGGVRFNGQGPVWDEIAIGNFYVIDVDYDPLVPTQRNNYIWASDIYETETSTIEWNAPYQRVFYSNIILEGLAKIVPTNNSEQVEWNQAKASALFFRAYNHYNIAKLFCKSYDENSANSDLGIPLRMESDINIPSTRSTVQQTYDQILSDLKEAQSLVSIQKPFSGDFKTQTRPNKAAILAMIARVYLAMSNYDSAFVYADKCLSIYNKLMNYNNDPSISSSGTFRVARFNSETLFYDEGNAFTVFSKCFIDSQYQMYTQNDKRKVVFCRSTTTGYKFSGSYAPSAATFFLGLATDEIYLIRAECYARKGNKTDALNDLNALWQMRWNNAAGTFIPIGANDANEALLNILAERRKELCFRGLLWSDLRRLNKESQFAVTIKRVVHNQTYTLLPNSHSYVLPIPPDVIQLSGIQQNQR